MKRYIACYDISSDRKRNKVLKRLKGLGFHSQLSFFELEARDGNSISETIKEFIENTDRFSAIRLSKKGKIRRIGSIIEGMEWVI